MIDHQRDVVNVNVFGLKKMNDIQTKSDDQHREFNSKHGCEVETNFETN